MFHLSFSSKPAFLDFVCSFKVLLKSNNLWRLLFLRSDVPISLQKLFITSLMWPYAAFSLKHLLIEDRKHHAYVTLYIQEMLGEAWLSVWLFMHAYMHGWLVVLVRIVHFFYVSEYSVLNDTCVMYTLPLLYIHGCVANFLFVKNFIDTCTVWKLIMQK